MFGCRCRAVIWNDVRNPARGLVKRTDFVANYIFDDGYPTLEECKAVVPQPEKWAYVLFHNNWYAVNAQSYRKAIVVSKEHAFVKMSRDGHFRCLQQEAPIPEILEIHNIGPGHWVDGIYCDLLRIDPEISVVRHDGHPYTDAMTISNTVVVVGIQFFATDICIRNGNYVNHAFKHYFNDRSMEDQLEIIRDLRDQGIEYLNPFTQNTAVDEKDKNRQKRAREKGIDMGEIVDDRLVLGGVKVMDDSDIFADQRANGMPYEGFRRRRKD